MSKVDEALVEVNAALAAMAPAHEGLRDFSKLNIKAETLAEVNEAIGIYDARKSYLDEAKRVLENLIGNGYPALVIPPVQETVFADLSEQETTISAALSQFSAIAEAATLTIVPGTPVEQ